MIVMKVRQRFRIYLLRFHEIVKLATKTAAVENDKKENGGHPGHLEDGVGYPPYRSC